MQFLSRYFRIGVSGLMVFFFAGSVKIEEDRSALNRLISITERKLESQKELKNLITEFEKQQALFYAGEQTKELASKMVFTAQSILSLIKENNYFYLFHSSFIEELYFFEKIDKK